MSSRQHEVAEELLESWNYICSVPGKNIRGLLVDAFQLWYQIPADKVEAIKEIVSKLHTASLMIDDVQDNSKLRRGIPVAHAVYGIPTTINTANYVYFLAMEECRKLDSQEAMDVLIYELLNLHRGQGFDIFWRDFCQCPNEEQYKQMILDKTGGLFRLAIGLMQAFSSQQQDFTDLVNDLALYFQIRDDYINLVSSSYHENKSYCEDFTEGKFSFPIIHAIKAEAGGHRILSILKQRPTDVDVKKHAVQFMHSLGSFEYTRTVLKSIRNSIYTKLEALGGNDLLMKIVKRLDQQLDDDLERQTSSSSLLIQPPNVEMI